MKVPRLPAVKTVSGLLMTACFLFATSSYAQDPNTVEKDSTEKKRTVAFDNDNRFTYMTAASFDFEEEAIPNYTGHFNIYAPNIGLGLFGVNCGIMKINYSSLIDPMEGFVMENVLLNPLHPPQAGGEYMRQFNRYEVVFENKARSLYVQPLIRCYVGKDDSAPTQIFIHPHCELLISKWVVTNTYTTIIQDTMTLDSASMNGFVARADIKAEYPYRSTIYTGYYGIGITADIRLGDKMRLFVQPTFGITTRSPLFKPTATYPYFDHIPYENDTYLFCLMRAYFLAEVTKETSLIFGVDIRDTIAVNQPQYAIYAGLNIGLDGIVGLIKK